MVLFLAVLSCFAIACGVFVLVAETNQAVAVALGVFALAMAQILITVTGWIGNGRMQSTVKGLILEKRAIDAKYRQTFVHADLFEREISDLRRRAEMAEKNQQDSVAANRAELHALNRRYEAATANLREHGEPEPQAFFDNPLPAPPRDQLGFLLEPIVDLSTNATAHYRARFSMAVADGEEVDFDRLVSNADRSGLRPSLDLLVISQSVPLLRRLRIKHPAMKMLLPIGAATLMSAASLAAIADSLGDAGDVADGVVFEITHAALGKLSEAGIAGLATIARMGATMAVTDASVAGLDLASLRQLGVLFIGIDAKTVESGFGVNAAWPAFLQAARGLQFQVVLTDVESSAQAASSAQIARYAAGSFFAPPRRVKLGAGVAAAAADLSAAA